VSENLYETGENLKKSEPTAFKKGKNIGKKVQKGLKFG